MAGRYEYEFVRVKVRDVWFKPFSPEYRQEIEAPAQQSWRFVQAYAPASTGWYGEATYCDLIFERELR